MDIEQHKNSLLLIEKARHYYDLGFNVLPVKIFVENGKEIKKPNVHSWKHWQTIRMTEEEFTSLPWGTSQYFGVICGFNGFSSVDADKLNEDQYKKVDAVLNQPVTEKIRTKRGYHWNYQDANVRRGEKKTREKSSFEYLGAGNFVIVGGLDNRYQRVNDNFPRQMSDAYALYKHALEALGWTKKPPLQQPKDLKEVRPCITAALNGKPLEESAGDKMRLCCAVEYLQAGYDVDQVVEVFSRAPAVQVDFDEEITRKKVEYAKEQKYETWKCETIRELGFCLDAKTCEWLKKFQREKGKKKQSNDQKKEPKDPRFFNEDEKFVSAWLGDIILEESRLVAISEKSRIWTYKPEKGIWEDDGIELVQRRATAYLGDNFHSGHVSEVCKYIRYTNYVDPDVFGSDPSKIVVENGVLNLETGELTPFDPELYKVNSIPVAYNPEARCPNIEEFLEEVCPREDYRQTLEDWVGYCLYIKYHIHNWLVLLGGGRNGKSVFLTLLGKFLGEKNTVDISIQDLCNRRFMPARLFGKLANIHADIPNNPLKYTGTLKMLTGGDRNTFDVKHRDPLDFRSYCKLIFSTNVLPKTEDKTDAFFSRPIIVEFPNQFLKNNPKTDPKILEKLTTPEELSGFLNLALKGLQRALKNGKISYPFTTDEMREQYQRFSDPLYAFLEETVEYEKEKSVTKKQLYDAYTKYANIHKLSAKPSNVFSREIRPLLTVNGVTDGYVGKERAWHGVRLKTQKEKEEQRRLGDFENK